MPPGSDAQTDGERRSNILRVMAAATAEQVPPVEEVTLLAAHMALLYMRGFAEPPESWPVEDRDDFPDVVPEILGDALNSWGLDPVPAEPGPRELVGWYEGIAAAFRQLGSDPEAFRGWQQQVTAFAHRHLDELLTPDVEEGARAIFTLLFLSLLRTAGIGDAASLAHLAEPAFEAALERLDGSHGEAGDGSDIASAVVEDLLERIQWHADEEWFTSGPGAFTWLGHRLALSVEIDASSRESEGSIGAHLAVRTVVVRDVTAGLEAVADLLNDINADAGCEAYVFDPSRRTVFAATDVWIDHRTRRLVDLILRDLVTNQLAAAESRGDLLAAALGGNLAVSRHPQLGLRPEPDLLVESSFNAFSRPFPLGLEDFAAIAHSHPLDAWDTSFAETGLTTEVPIEVAPGWTSESSVQATALLTLSGGPPPAPR